MRHLYCSTVASCFFEDRIAMYGKIVQARHNIQNKVHGQCETTFKTMLKK